MLHYGLAGLRALRIGRFQLVYAWIDFEPKFLLVLHKSRFFRDIVEFVIDHLPKFDQE